MSTPAPCGRQHGPSTRCRHCDDIDPVRPHGRLRTAEWGLVTVISVRRGVVRFIDADGEEHSTSPSILREAAL